MLFSTDFYKDKKVFITGHTGFKGSWLCMILSQLGAKVTGYSLCPQTEPSLYDASGISECIDSVIGDIRDIDSLKKAFDSASPEIVFHLAAQPIVRDSYRDPVYTYETNVMGTVNILECIRGSNTVRSFVNVTTDKVYKNREWEWGYREDDELCGYDPYSNSKSCSELVTYSYKASFLNERKTAVSTVRAGNVIGGGDFANDRIIPDCVRAAVSGNTIILRNALSVRPYQFILEPLYVYLMIAAAQYEDISLAGNYNVGPDESDIINTGTLADIFCSKWGGAQWVGRSESEAPHEANFLKLDCSRLKKVFAWRPRYNIDTAVEKTVMWYKCFYNSENTALMMRKQIKEFLEYSF